ncbi:acyl-CoA thioesterase [Tuberibacillus sp. Marseille-P3662]|uniref:acyl-CoA thioesterase n=1 Tax=Tuberibacillus sp. Marseille-P3662 TaxID=1965358 RepID=UPI000A1C7E84|nr:thioesterase family protein [Tuberibacillus sp. Marseille-P3662]
MQHETELKVRFVETDAIGHVNNVSYYIYLEQARIEFLESLGTAMTISDWKFVVVHMNLDFVGQSYFNDRLNVTTNIRRIGTKSFTLVHRIYRKETGETVVEGEAVLVYFNFDTQESESMPESLKNQLIPYQRSRETV